MCNFHMIFFFLQEQKKKKIWLFKAEINNININWEEELRMLCDKPSHPLQ